MTAAAVPADDGGYSVTVQYVEKNPPKLTTQAVQTEAGADGRWSVEFNSAKASFRPTWIVAKRGSDVIAVRNVLIGEIWVCAGQSNMGWSNFNRKGREAASAGAPSQWTPKCRPLAAATTSFATSNIAH